MWPEAVAGSLVTEAVRGEGGRLYNAKGERFFDTGETGVSGLYAVGEATSGVHGANRLGGNSLAEIFVFGRLVGAHLAHSIGTYAHRTISNGLIKDPINALQAPLQRDDGPDPISLTNQIKQIMWECAGIVRRENDTPRISHASVPPIPEDLLKALGQGHELDYHYVE